MPRGDGRPAKTRRTRRPKTEEKPQQRSKRLAARIDWWEDLKGDGGLGQKVKYDKQGQSFTRPGSQNREKWGK